MKGESTWLFKIITDCRIFYKVMTTHVIYKLMYHQITHQNKVSNSPLPFCRWQKIDTSLHHHLNTTKTANIQQNSMQKRVRYQSHGLALSDILALVERNRNKVLKESEQEGKGQVVISQTKQLIKSLGVSFRGMV